MSIRAHFRSRSHRGRAAVGVSAALILTAFTTAADAFRPLDTQRFGQPLAPAEAAKRLRVPDGFRVTLAAAEPDVRQPIALAYDDRGRLWVAESYSYDGSHFTDVRHDRILIFEDADGDGVFESRRVFHDRLNRLTGLAPGFGGVWVTTAPHLAFIPDRDGNDVPDGEPIVHLDGWTLEAEHNTVNGLTWGPDGWLYGRHGIKKASLVGRPGTPDSQRTEVACAIWRYHPARHAFEVVADGTINPWGLDFNEHGHAFASTSVVDHLWHVVPGGRFERWRDRVGHPHPYTYEQMTSTSDHLHWGGGTWDKGGRLSGGNDALGGGHSHSDAMIYLGDRWPAEYRGSIFLSNIHGRRINRDALARRPGDGAFVAIHRPDFLTADDPWFRAISLAYGPDGDVVLSDWSDFGECHDRDGVHRSSGRLYKLSWGAPRRVAVDLARESDERLVALHSHANEWFVRHARRLLQERAHAGRTLSAVHAALRRQFTGAATTPLRLRALWTLHVTGGADATFLRTLLAAPDEHLRHWAVRLLTDDRPNAAIAESLATHARTERSWLVQTALASALGRFDPATRAPLAHALARGCTADTAANLVRLIWYGLEPCVTADPRAAARLAVETGSPKLRQFLARRLAEAMSAQPAAGEALFETLESVPTASSQLDLIAGLGRGLDGAKNPNPPARAPPLLRRLAASDDAGVRDHALQLAALFGDESAVATLRRTLADPAASSALREATLARLATLKPSGFGDDLLALVRTGQLVEPALRALPAFADRRVADAVLEIFPRLAPAARRTAVDALVSRAATARPLLAAIAAGQIERREISLVQARQISQFRDAELSALLERAWGTVGRTSSDVAATMSRLRHELTSAVLAEADLAAGALVYELRCATCHVLFGRGQPTGPDLTGSGRKDLEYLLLNIVDPNATIAADYRLTIVTLQDGQVHSGSVLRETDTALAVRTLTGEIALNRADVKSVQPLPMSMMPPGILDELTPRERRDLFGYLMSDGPPGR